MKSLEDTSIVSLQDLVKSVSIHLSGIGQYERFQRLYENDRIAFVYDVLPELGKTFTDYQEEILGLYDSGYSRVAVRGPHGLGKTTLAAVIDHHMCLTTSTDAKIPTTASAWRQLEKYLWPEIRKIARLIRWDVVGRQPYDQRLELLSMSIKMNGGLVESFAVASDDHTTIEGAHGTKIFYIMDEAKSIPRSTWHAIEGAFSNAGAKVMGESIASDYVAGERGVYSRSTPAPELDIVEEASVVSHTVGGNGSKEYSISNNVSIQKEAISNNVSAINKDNVSSNKGDISAINRNITSPLSSPLIYNDSRAHARNSSSPNGDRVTIVSKQSNEERASIHSSIVVPTIAEAYALAISTPGTTSGQFYDIHMRKPGFEDWIARHVSIDEAIRAGRVTQHWADMMLRQLGPDNPEYMNRVLGEFADVSGEGIIPLSWVIASMNRWREWDKKGRPYVHGRKTLGVDVARGGDDKTVIASRTGSLLSNVYVFAKLPTTATTGHVKNHSSERYINIEVDGGLGAAVYDQLKEQNVPLLRPIIVGGSTRFRDKSGKLSFDDVRSAMWWNMRELLDPDNGEEVMLPPIEELKTDLTAPKWEPLSEGVIKLEAKKYIRERIGRSTDYGDAVCLAFWNTSGGGGVVI